MKQQHPVIVHRLLVDAPHTGARLETKHEPERIMKALAMPPTRGHDLKLLDDDQCAVSVRCPPHGGTT